MALFGKKKEVEYCAICGKERKTGFLRGLFQSTVDGQYVCSDCYGMVDVDSDILNKMTIPEFKEYIQFREENQKLKEQFETTNTFDFGIFDTKIVFDQTHGYLAFSTALDKTIFERKHLTSFVIKEDDHVIFEGDANGLHSYETEVYNELRRMYTRFSAYRQEVRSYENRLARLSASERQSGADQHPSFSGIEPFSSFNVDIFLDHPYWKKFHFDMAGPRFSNGLSIEEIYRHEYQSNYNKMEQLANDFMNFAFSGTCSGSTEGAAPQEDVTDTLKRLKELLDMGILTEEEFTAKKRQLLGL